MATRRTTSNKRERERSKQAKAAAKRERRLDKSPDEETAKTRSSSTRTRRRPRSSIERIAAMHEKYDDGQMTFEAFDEEKSELMALLTARLSE